ncbi:MAG: hypothetical protein ACYC43_09080 [Burkholderiales bacterium]
MSDAFGQGQSIGSGAINGAFAGINTTTEQTNIPSFGASTSTQSGYYGNGDGNIETPGAAEISTCANAAPSSDPMANQYCNAVNFLATNPSVRPQMTISPNDSLMQNAKAISQNANTILQSNGISAAGSTSQCVPATITTPAQYTTEMCTTAQGLATTQCVMGRVVNITDNTNYQCNQTVNAYQTKTCDRTLSVNIPSTIPATASYSCPSGQLLIDRQCQSASIAATVNYSCSTGSSLNGTTCQPAPSTPTANYSCGVGQTVSGSSCVTPATNAYLNYSCNIGDTLSGTICTPPSTSTAATANYSCPSGSTLNGTQCQAPASQGPGVGATNNGCNTIPYLPQFNTGANNVNNYVGPCKVVAASPTCASVGEGEITMFMSRSQQAKFHKINTSHFWANVCVPATSANFSCPSGYALSGTTCYPPTITPPPTPAPVNYSCSSGTLVGTSCQSNGVPYNAISTYSCPYGGAVSGSQCVSPVTSAIASYSCPVGNSLVNSQCYPPPVGATTSYTCPASYIMSGTNCSLPITTATVTYTCAPGMTLSGSSCQPIPITSWQDGCSALEAQAQ